jgi:hypothetical protein
VSDLRNTVLADATVPDLRKTVPDLHVHVAPSGIVLDLRMTCTGSLRIS